ncbi:hypothetical protein G3436_15215 [Pseudomonas sp. MAFF212427]|uniref:Transporter n=1 Tax=Pseudomonas brassicae TaxID=2708063 RepID=A0A6B3NS72_9PSED|nr:autotransporter-associated beta strand repeat-containing protein [Pseudomonas brassicae]NER64969.1 hypothetical protein [Pseudomonas brassicae]
MVLGNNTFSGTLDITQGMVTSLSANALGNLASVNLGSGTDLNLNGNTTIGTLTGSGTTSIALGSTLSLGGNNLDSVYAGTFGGNGGLRKVGNGVLELSGISSLGGTSQVNAGTLKVSGSLNGGSLTVSNGATLTGSGSLGGGVSIANGGHLVGTSGTQLKFGSLTISPNSIIDVALGSPLTGATSLFNVAGTLTLDGTLNITDDGGLGNGVYRLFDYTSLVNNGMILGGLPGSVTPGELQLQTAIAGQVNLLINSPNLLVQFWDGQGTVADGTVQGGSGTWNNSSTNWTDLNGTDNDAWFDQFAIFQGAAGVVTVEGSQTANALQFVTDGYQLVAGTGGELNAINGNRGSFVVRVDPNVTATLDLPVNGTGTLAKLDTGTLVLNGANGYTGGTLLNGGTLVVGNGSALGSGTLTAANGTTLDSNQAVSLGNAIGLLGQLRIGGSNALTLDGDISGNGGLLKAGAGTLTLGGGNTLSGATTVSGGSLIVNGSLASNTVTVNSGATVGGTGSLGGTLTVADGGHLSMRSGSTLSVGSLVLGADANLDAALGAPVVGTAGLINVGGNLTLDGKLNVTDIGGFDSGVYRLIDYTGTLINNGLNIGSVPNGVVPGDLDVQTAINNQVNLVVGGTNNTVLFWDGSQTTGNGSVAGGSGVWSVGGTNWTNANGTVNQAWNDTFAVFQGTGGAVTLDGVQTLNGMQFLDNGYTLSGDALALTNGASGTSNVRIGTGISATLDVAVNGNATLAKLEGGTLVLNGNNTYTGGTQLNGGTLVAGSDTALGLGALSTQGGTTLDSNTAVNLANAVVLNGSLTLAGSHDLTLSGVVSGNGELNKQGASELTLSGNNTFSGALNVLSGKLSLIGNTALGNAHLNVANNASASVFGVNNLNALTGSGALLLAAGSTLQVGARGASSVYDGSINGAGHLTKIGSGKQVLNGNSTVEGGTTVAAGSLIIGGAAGSNANLASNVDVAMGAILGGHGTINGDINLASGATLNPGNSIGTLNVAGDINFNSGSTLVIEADPDGRSDRVIATGTVSLGGSGLNIVAGAATGRRAPSTGLLRRAI